MKPQQALTRPAWIAPIHDVEVLRCARCGRTKAIRLPKDKLYAVQAGIFIEVHAKCADPLVKWQAT